MLLALLLPCRFLWPLKANFYVDWYNHKWTIGYFGEYFRHHGVMPAVFNTTQWGGMATPIFYGYLAYPILGIFSSVLAPGTVIRLVAVFLFAAQYHWVNQALRRLEAPRWMAQSVACLVIWATYPLTNLYNRSALTEFVATSLMTCALSLAILLYYSTSKALERRYASWMVLCLVISAGTHPITALFGIPFFCIIAVILVQALGRNPERRRSILYSLAPGIFAGLVCLAPWLVATAKYAKHLAIRRAVPAVVFFPESLDNWLTRFYPIPLDSRVQPGIPLSEISTPYLDAQVNVSLLILFLALAVGALSARRKLGPSGRFFATIAIPALLFAFFTWISLSPASYHYLPAIAAMIQFAYRAVTYQNFALLLGIILLLIAIQRSRSPHAAGILNHPALSVVAAGCILLSAYGVVLKWPHIRASRSNVGSESSLLIPSEAERRELIDLPLVYYGVYDYTAGDRFVPLTVAEEGKVSEVNFNFDSQDNFGAALPAEINDAETRWVRTNIQAFPWNRIEIDGREFSKSDVRVYDAVGIVLRIPAGSHRLVFRFVPDRVWEILRPVSLCTLFGWLLIETAFCAIGSLRRGYANLFGSCN